MVKYNNTSILRRIDQHDLRSLRRIMMALNHGINVTKKYCLNSKEGEELLLTQNERNRVNDLMRAIYSTSAVYPLLGMAIQRFVKARFAADHSVIDATRELDGLAEEDVLLVPGAHIEEYEEAVRRYHKLSSCKSSLSPDKPEESPALATVGCRGLQRNG